MPLSRGVAVPAILSEYEAFAGLLRSVSDADLATPSRCAGWTVGDVAAHLVGQLTDVVNLRLDGLGSPEATQRQADERKGRTAAELAEELEQSIKLAADLLAGFDDAAWAAPAPGGTPGTLGFGVEALWYDAFVHADDVRSALGRSPEITEGMLGSLSHLSDALTDRGWKPATLAFAGYPEFPISGGGEPVTGDPMQFVLAASGRIDPATVGLDDTVNIFGV